MLIPLLFLLPLGLDTLAVSLSLGIKSALHVTTQHKEERLVIPTWLCSAMLFSLAETLMPLVGLLIGYTASLVVSNIMHYAGALILIGIGAWELWEEGRGYFARWMFRRRGWRATQASPPHPTSTPAPAEKPALIEGPRRVPPRFEWGRQLLLALSVSLDELAIGFSLGSLPFGKALSPLALCLYIGIQGFVLAALGIALGRALRARLKPLKEGSEILGAVLLIGLGIWLLFA